jgi:hypothetical protein
VELVVGRCPGVSGAGRICLVLAGRWWRGCRRGAVVDGAGGE